MKGISKSAKVAMKIMEVGHWVAVGLMALAAVFSIAAPKLLQYVMDTESLRENGEISAYGFEVIATNAAGDINYTTVFLFSIGAVAIFVLMALVFRNLYSIIRKSESSTPFSQDNIRSLKKIGIFSIVVPLVGFIMSAVIYLVIGAEATEINIDQNGVIMGIIVMCLTQYFIHGAELEKDVDGLL